jgi:hypothetical protein
MKKGWGSKRNINYTYDEDLGIIRKGGGGKGYRSGGDETGKGGTGG